MGSAVVLPRLVKPCVYSIIKSSLVICKLIYNTAHVFFHCWNLNPDDCVVECA